jgi:hypothetical protein
MGAAAGSDRRVARTDPAITRANPTLIPTVSGSPSRMTPSVTATAGLTYVMTVERTGPTSSMSLKNTRNAIAVHSTARVSTEAITFADGQRGPKRVRESRAESERAAVGIVEVRRGVGYDASLGGDSVTLQLMLGTVVDVQQVLSGQPARPHPGRRWRG